MSELRQRKLSEPQYGIPTSVDARSAGSAPRRRKNKSERDLLLFATPLILFLHVALVTFSVRRIYATPAVPPRDAPANSFSEARSLDTVKDLTETIGFRIVSTPGVDEAHHYMLQQARQLVAQAKKRGGLIAEVEEQRVSGGVDMTYFHEPIGSVYQGLGNVMLRLAPTHQQAASNSTLLLNAHYDSTLGSQGAADCASCVAVLLEVARVLVSDPSIHLPGPVLFLFNGGEETLMQAAHGFVSSGHRWVSDTGAFINLEATGSGGPDTLFQHTGGWTAETYAAAAKYPRGSVFLQDVFEAGFIPSDTDYRMFSAATGQLGHWPGLDIAHILDSATYHTRQDSLQRLRPGILQAMGENTLEALLAISHRLSTGDVPKHVASKAKSVFFDVGGYFMVTYPMAVASLLHLAPLALTTLTLIAMMKSATHDEVYDQFRATVVPVARQAGLSVASFLCAVLVPAALGALRAGLSGNPMAWYSSPPLAYCIYLPMALAAAALPYALTHTPHSSAPSQTRPLQAALLGYALVISAVAGLSVALGMGSGYLFAAWGVCALLAAGFVTLVQEPLFALLGSMALALPAQALSLPLSLSLLIHCVGKANMAGAAPVAQTLVLDAVSGALIGSFTWLNLGFVAPTLAYVYRHRLPAAMAALSLFCFVTAVLGSCAPEAYSDAMPKRVISQHLNHHDADGNILDTRWVVAAVDGVPIERALYNVNYTRIAPIDNDWQTFYPLGAIFQTVHMEAPQPQRNHRGPHTTVKVTRESVTGSARWLQVEMKLPAAGWGVLNITSAGLRDWSLTDSVVASAQPTYPQGDIKQHMVRFSCNQGYKDWNFWLEVDASHPEVLMKVAVSLLEETDAISDFNSHLPSWTSEVAVTTYQSSWKL